MEVSGHLAAKQRKRENAEIDITPMIDVVFLLLAFFVIVSTMDPKRNPNLPVSEVMQNVLDDNCVLIYVDQPITPETGGTVFLPAGDSGDVQLSGPPEKQAEDIEAYVRTAMDNPKKTHVLIKASGDSHNGLIERIKIAAARGAGERPVKLLIGVEDKKR